MSGTYRGGWRRKDLAGMVSYLNYNMKCLSYSLGWHIFERLF